MPATPDAPWSAAAAIPGSTFADVARWWYEFVEPEAECPLLVPVGYPAQPVEIPYVPSQGAPIIFDFGDDNAGWMETIVPPLSTSDPTLDPFYASDTAVIVFADGSAERISSAGDGDYLISLPGVGCVYIVHQPAARVDQISLFQSLRVVASPPGAATTPAMPTQPQPVACPVGGVDVLRLGDGPCDSVRELQELLSWTRDIQVDGVFGASTEQAVRDFQAEVGLAVDGLVGPQTWAALLNSVGDY